MNKRESEQFERDHPGWKAETDDHGNFKMFHSHWGDDLAEKLSYPIIINK